MLILHFKKFGAFIAIFTITVAAGISSSASAQTEGASPQIIITEIGVKETADEEWVEIYNTTDVPVDLTGWKFFEAETNHGISVFAGSSVMQPGEYAVIANKGDLLAQKYPAYTGTIFDSSWGSLKEEGEEIGMKDADGSVSELFPYPAFSGNSISLERVDFNTPASEPTNWAAHPASHSLGKPNEIGLPLEPAESTEGASPPLTESAVTPPPATTEPLPLSETSPLPSAPPPVSFSSSTPSPTPNNPPKAIIQIQSGELVAVGQTTVNFDARASFDPDGDTLFFSWDMGDGSKEETANPSPHKYGKPGTYVVRLTVTDSEGASDKTEQYIQVVNGIKSATEKSVQSSPMPSFMPFTLFPVQNTGTGDKQSPLVIEIRGELLFSMAENKTAAKKKTKKKTSKKTSVKSTTKEKKQSAKKKFLNGDISDAIKITELLPDPVEDEEWIELLNNGKDAVRLGNWQLVDSSGKAEKAFTFPDSTELGPGAYLVFKKSETKLALNNNKDRLEIRDYEGTIIDTISYEGSKKGYSYALIEYVGPARVASADPRFLPSASRSSWEWVSQPTPKAKNPQYEIIEGFIENAELASEETMFFSLQTKNGELKTIHFTAETLDLLTAQTVLAPQNNLRLSAQKQDDGTYVLQKIETVTPPVEQTKPDDDSFFKKNFLVLLMIPGALGTIIICTVMLVKIFKT